jgi:hypothetical protein
MTTAAPPRPQRPVPLGPPSAGGGGGGGGGLGISGANVPVTASLLPKASTTYSDWLVKQMDASLLQENSAQGPKHYQQNKEIFWGTFADWAQNNPKELKTTLYAFMADENNWIFGFFPIKISKATRAIQQSLEIHQVLPTIGTRKVPFRNISSSVSVREKHAIYTAQGFQMDYHFMKTPDGMSAWDRMVDALTANLWSFVIYQSINEVQFEPSWYRKQNQLYPFTDVPRTVDELFDYERRNLFKLNKKPQAFHELLADSGRIMNQKQEKPTGLIMSRDDLWYAHGRDPTQCYYDKSGPISLRARSNAGNEKTVDGAKIYAIPLAMGRLNDEHFTPLLRNMFQTGGFVRMRDLTINLPASEYSSEKRSIRLASVSLNSMKKYTLIETLQHVPEFYPVDYQAVNPDGSNAFDFDERNQGGLDEHDDDVYYHNDGTDRMYDNPSSPRGQINRNILWQLINDRKHVFETRMRTKLEGNEELINTLIRFDKEIKTESKMYPIDMMGELSECNAKTKYMGHVYRTMEHAIFSDIGAEGIAKLEAGMRLAKYLNRPNMNVQDIEIDVAKFASAVGDQTGNKQRRLQIGFAMTDNGSDGQPILKTNYFAQNRVLPNNLTPWGLGSIWGFAGIIDGSDLSQAYSPNIRQTVADFMSVYKQIITKLVTLCPENPCLSPSLIPVHLNNPEMTDFTRIMIVAWSTIFSNFVTPNVVDNPTTQNTSYLTQFTFDTPNKYFGHAGLKTATGSHMPFELLIGPASYNANLYTGDFADVNNEDDKTFGGTLFTALPFIHPNLPLLERSGDIGESLRRRPEMSHVPISKNRTGKPFRPWFNTEADKLTLMSERQKPEYTKELYEEYQNNPFYKNFPAALIQMIANPLVRNSNKTVSDFEARFIASHTYSASLGIAARAVLFSRVNLNTLTTWFDNNIAIPFGAMLIRPFETQDCTSAIAVADGPIGTTFFSGMDNHVSFDPSAQHFTVQAFLHCMPVVQNNHKYLMLPIVRGGPFYGGKGHLFVNQNSKMCLNEMERLKELVENNNGEALGNNSIIATLTPYNYAVEKQEVHHFDLRNNYRREDFSGRLQNCADFVLQKQTLAYPAAPILNTIFDWDIQLSSELMEDQSFSQYMKGRQRNYHQHETLCEEWDIVKGTGWVQTQSYHVWDKTEQTGCAEVQTSHASVVKAVI